MRKYYRFLAVFCLVPLVVIVMDAGDARPGMSPRVKDLAALSQQGDTKAMCDLALAYYHGKGVLKDPFKAKCWVRKAHDLGEARAEKIWNSLGLWKYTGDCPQTAGMAPGNGIQGIRGGDLWQEPITGMIFVWVPGDCYQMGCHKNAGKCEDDAYPLHQVCLDGFWIGAHEVTQGQWKVIMGANPSRFKNGDDHPVESVSFDRVKGFISGLNSRSPHRFKLPTEAQWEYVCRNGGKPRPYFWGREKFRPHANCGTCDSGSYQGRTAPTGSYPPNGMGIYDMGGNVREWCRDVYEETAYATHKKDNPVVRTKGRDRVVRGGAFSDNAVFTGCARRGRMAAHMKNQGVGFRLVMKKRSG